MRTHVKKKNYAEHVRSQVLAGLINNPNGDWTTVNGAVTEKSKTFSLAGTAGKRWRGRR